MSETNDARSIRFYFSFRSPYAWLAAERLDAELGTLPVAIELLPIYPPPDHVLTNLAAMPQKILYIAQDIGRLAREQGLTVRFPPLADPDWSLPHAAFLHAQQYGGGRAFMLEMFRKRFAEGLDLGDDAVIGDAARAAHVDPTAVVCAAHSGELRSAVSAGWSRGVERDGIFGVPSFVYAGKLYWGQDRMHFLRGAVMRKSGAGS
jgi:2-hydroxychromene-2-carboxylate isomerase